MEMDTPLLFFIVLFFMTEFAPAVMAAVPELLNKQSEIVLFSTTEFVPT